MRLASKRFSVCARAYRIFFENKPNSYDLEFSALSGEIACVHTLRANFFVMCDTEQSFSFGTGTLRRELIEQSQSGLPILLTSGSVTMLYTIAVILLILWLLGLVTSYTLGGFIHILLVVAIVVILLRVISGRKPL